VAGIVDVSGGDDSSWLDLSVGGLCVQSRERRLTRDDQPLDMDAESEANIDGRLLFFVEEARACDTGL